jgi:hypothetical protein
MKDDKQRIGNALIIIGVVILGYNLLFHPLGASPPTFWCKECVDSDGDNPMVASTLTCGQILPDQCMDGSTQLEFVCTGIQNAKGAWGASYKEHSQEGFFCRDGRLIEEVLCEELGYHSQAVPNAQCTYKYVESTYGYCYQCTGDTIITTLAPVSTTQNSPTTAPIVSTTQNSPTTSPITTTTTTNYAVATTCDSLGCYYQGTTTTLPTNTPQTYPIPLDILTWTGIGCVTVGLIIKKITA